MANIAVVLALAGIVGLAGAALGVRNLKRQTEITIERGASRLVEPIGWEPENRAL